VCCIEGIFGVQSVQYIVRITGEYINNIVGDVVLYWWSKRLTAQYKRCTQPHRGKLPLCGVRLAQLNGKCFCRSV